MLAACEFCSRVGSDASAATSLNIDSANASAGAGVLLSLSGQCIAATKILGTALSCCHPRYSLSARERQNTGKFCVRAIACGVFSRKLSIRTVAASCGQASGKRRLWPHTQHTHISICFFFRSCCCCYFCKAILKLKFLFIFEAFLCTCCDFYCLYWRALLVNCQILGVGLLNFLFYV